MPFLPKHLLKIPMTGEDVFRLDAGYQGDGVPGYPGNCLFLEYLSLLNGKPFNIS